MTVVDDGLPMVRRSGLVVPLEREAVKVSEDSIKISLRMETGTFIV